MDKSFVTLEQAQCPVCGLLHETGDLLLDKRMRKKFDKYTPTHWAPCPTHKKIYEDGYLALVEVTNYPGGGELTPDTADRTGNLAFIRYEVAKAFVNTDISRTTPMVYVEVGVVEEIRKVYEKHTGEPAPEAPL